MNLSLSASCSAPIASGAEEPNVLRLVAATHRPQDDAVVLDELVRSAGQTSAPVPGVHKAFHLLRNRVGQTGIKFPLDALLIIPLQHDEKRRYILGSAIT